MKSRNKEALTLMPRPEIDQTDLAPIVARRNAARRMVQELRADSLRMIKLIEKGSHIEPGVHTVEIGETVEGHKIVKRLLVDGEPVENW